MRRFLVPVVLLALAACGDEGASEGPRWLTYRDNELGFSVRYPADWHRAGERLTPNLGDPKEILSLATYPLRPGGSRCSHMPVNALEDFGRREAFLSIQERAKPGAGEFVPRHPFAAPNDSHTGRFCVPDPERLDEWLFVRDAGRGFYVIAALGTDASPETRASLVRVMNSLEFEPR